MFFEAIIKKTKYQIHVTESRTMWHVSLQKEGDEWRKHDIAKEHFQEMDGAISFLFNNGCYMIDVVGDGLDYTAYTRGSYRNIKIMNDEMLLHESLKKGGGMNSDGSLVAGMPGKIVKVMVEPNQEVLRRHTFARHGGHENGKRNACWQ